MSAQGRPGYYDTVGFADLLEEVFKEVGPLDFVELLKRLPLEAEA
jgi:hypothetical protein